MRAREKVLKLLERSGEDGILQSEIVQQLNLSKSTVSEILSQLEGEDLIFRRLVSGRSMRVWLKKHVPFPIEGYIRIGILKSTEYAAVVRAAKEVSSGVAEVRLYGDAISLTKDVVYNRIDVAASPLVTQTLFGILHKNIRIVRKVAEGGSGIVYGDTSNGVFGTTEMSTMEMNIKKVREVFNVRQLRYFRSPENMVKSFLEGELEGIAIWEPHLTWLEKKGYRVMPFSQLIGSFPCCSLAANVDALRINSELIEEFLLRYDSIVGEVSQELSPEIMQKYAADIAEILGVEVGLAGESLKRYRFNGKLQAENVAEFLRKWGMNVSVESLKEIILP